MDVGLGVRSEGLGIHLVWRHREGSEGTFLCHFSSLGAGGQSRMITMEKIGTSYLGITCLK
jgi:hypothetical protein